ncbi:MAG: hypothetical protein ACLP1X_17900 [Polyangiaceae bacterium]
MSPARRSLGLSVARFLVAFGLLVAPWRGLGRAFTEAAGAVATAVADPFFGSSNVTFVLRAPVPSERLGDWRGVVDVKQDFPEGPVRHAGAIDMRRAGYLQLATFLSLAAGWPPRRHSRALLAVVVATLVVASTLGVAALDFLCSLGAVHAWAWFATAVALARRALVGAPGMAYAIPGLVWLALRDREGTNDAFMTVPQRSRVAGVRQL